MLQHRASQMAIFHVLVESGSFTLAAEKLNVSVSHVSKQLSILESELNIQLIRRTTRNFTLTEAGKHFAHHCHKIIIQVNEANSLIDNARDEISGVLKLGVSQSFGTLHIIPHLDHLQKHYPNLIIELRLFDHKTDMLEENLDLWLTNYEAIPDGYVAQRLAETRFILAASPHYLINHPLPHHPEDLKQHNCLIYQSRLRQYNHWMFSKNNEKLSVTVSGNYRVDLAQAVRDAAVSGWGIAYLATYLLKDEFKQGHLVQLLPQWKACQHMPFYAVYPRRKHLPKKITATLKFLKDHIGHAPWDAYLKPYLQVNNE